TSQLAYVGFARASSSHLFRSSLESHAAPRHLHSFPTRRSSDLFSAPYIPGWDCHGLPIEFKVSQEMNKEFEAMWLELQTPYSFRSEEHTSELQSRENLVCRLLPETKGTTTSPAAWPRAASAPGS